MGIKLSSHIRNDNFIEAIETTNHPLYSLEQKRVHCLRWVICCHGKMTFIFCWHLQMKIGVSTKKPNFLPYAIRCKYYDVFSLSYELSVRCPRYTNESSVPFRQIRKHDVHCTCCEIDTSRSMQFKFSDAQLVTRNMIQYNFDSLYNCGHFNITWLRKMSTTPYGS